MKKDYWKLVCEEWPEGIFFLCRQDAREYAELERENGYKVYIRRVRMNEEEFEAIPEL